MIMNYANREDARKAWHARFHNRSPATAKTTKLEIKNVAAGTVDILLYDEIGFWGVTAKEFVAALAGITATTINVRINSPGGDVFDGLAIYNALKAHPAKIVSTIEGIAASAASFIALAGETVTMAPSAFMMIHKAWGFTIGNADDHRDAVNTLDKIDGQLAAVYATKTGKSADEMLALMKGESDGTWFTGDEAKAIGLVDALVTGKDATTETVDPDADDDDQQDPAESSGLGARMRNMRQRLALAHHEV